MTDYALDTHRDNHAADVLADERHAATAVETGYTMSDPAVRLHAVHAAAVEFPEWGGERPVSGDTLARGTRARRGTDRAVGNPDRFHPATINHHAARTLWPATTRLYA